ncbi:MAG: DUF1223 domain-containing protein [Acidobacteriota bacterium]
MNWKVAARRELVPLLVLLCVGRPTRAAKMETAKTPVLVELFTSQGCPSCPPADAWVQTLDATQPVPDAQVIVLSEHVDYFDEDGWTDPYSQEQLSDRQGAYARSLRLTVYTPQIILDGDAELHAYDAAQTRQKLEQAATAPALPMHLDHAEDDGRGLTVHVATDAGAPTQSGDVFLAVAIDKTVSDVLAGANDGKTLTNVAVVKQLVKIGKVEQGKPFDLTFYLKLWPFADPANMRVVAFVQEPGPGKVLGVAMTKEIRKGQ